MLIRIVVNRLNVTLFHNLYKWKWFSLYKDDEYIQYDIGPFAVSWWRIDLYDNEEVNRQVHR